MSKAILTEKSNLDKEVIPRCNELQSLYLESTVDCPDCSDIMIKSYDSEYKTRYYCENCDLFMGEVCVVGGGGMY